MEASTLVLPALIALSLLAIITSAIGIVFQIRRERMPDATRFENVRELREQEERTLADRRAELSIVEQKIQDRDRLIAEVSAYDERVQQLRAELESLEPARADIEATRRDAADAAAELAEQVQKLADVEERLAERNRQWDNLDEEKEAKKQAIEAAVRRLEQIGSDIERMSSERLAVEKELGPLLAERDAALRAIADSQLVEARVAAMTIQLETLAAGVSDALEQKRDLDTIQAGLAQSRVEQARLEESVTRLAALRAKLSAETSGDVSEADEAALIADLRQSPNALASPAMLRGSRRSETEALQSVSGYLKDLGLKYSKRTVRSFHTALKINDFSQLTVLAGVSGTGKSLLPRRYAEAMGIHFLQIAVEPRWDSPQDLLGFYNYVEKRYRATDLARLMVQLDPYDTSGLREGDRSDHMGLVLLDEMNLARVEYYFSEFLSRLESRPRQSDVADPVKRSDAKIPLDIRGLSRSLSLFPSHNVMFAGTMNDDESTQALSDKVLDRGNVMQFAAPKTFEKPRADANVERPKGAQSFSQWREWIQTADTMVVQRRQLIDGHVEKLADIMERCGRPFGHRLRDAMLAYVANYPGNDGSGGDAVALADQVEFRIMPKLRGLEIDGHAQELDDLEVLLRDLGDMEFANRVGDLRSQQSAGTGLFVWRGLTRGE